MKILYKIFTVTMVLFLFAGCKKEKYAELNKANGPLVLTASKDVFILNEREKENDALVLSWTTGTNHGTNTAINYTLQLAKAGESFSNPVAENIGKALYSRKFTVGSLNDTVLNHFGGVPGIESVLEARVIAQAGVSGADAEISPVITIKITPYQPVSATLFLVGDATPNGWDNTAATPLVAVLNQPGTFSWTGHLNGGNLKFLITNGQWLPSYNKGGNETTLFYRTDNAQADDQWQVTSGTYSITANLLDLTVSIVQSSLPPYAHLWIIGDATPAGWNINTPDEMHVDSTNFFAFNYNEILTAGEFKIPTATGNFGCDYYMPPTNHPPLTATDVQLTPAGSPDTKWQITTAGAYKIHLDLLNMAISIKPFTPYTQLWLVGDATPAGWNINTPVPMTVNGTNPYEFSWTGPMTPGEFKIPTATGNWSCDYFMPLVDQQGIFSKLAKFVSAGNPDHKWRITNAGNYKITLNQLKETVAIEKL